MAKKKKEKPAPADEVTSDAGASDSAPESSEQKSDFENHPKFDKFKKEKDGN